VLAALIVLQGQELRKQGTLFMGAVVIFGAATILFGLSRFLVLAWCALAISGGIGCILGVLWISRKWPIKRNLTFV
jgi:intracellular septation protein A